MQKKSFIPERIVAKLSRIEVLDSVPVFHSE